MSFGKQSVTSWFAGMRFRFWSMLASALSPDGCLWVPISTRHSKFDARHAACWRTAFAPLPFYPHLSLSLSLSLSLTHTHTHTFRAASCFDFTVACCGQSSHAILAPKMLPSHTEHPDFLCSPRDIIVPLPPPLPPAPPPPSPHQPPLSRSKQRSAAKKASLALS